MLDDQDRGLVHNNCDAASMPQHAAKPSDTPNMSTLSTSAQPVNMITRFLNDHAPVTHQGPVELNMDFGKLSLHNKAPGHARVVSTTGAVYKATAPSAVPASVAKAIDAPPKSLAPAPARYDIDRATGFVNGQSPRDLIPNSIECLASTAACRAYMQGIITMHQRCPKNEDEDRMTLQLLRTQEALLRYVEAVEEEVENGDEEN